MMHIYENTTKNGITVGDMVDVSRDYGYFFDDDKYFIRWSNIMQDGDCVAPALAVFDPDEPFTALYAIQVDDGVDANDDRICHDWYEKAKAEFLEFFREGGLDA